MPTHFPLPLVITARMRACNRPLQFHERSQHFIGTHDETFSVAMRVHNPDRAAFKINGRETEKRVLAFCG
jgi:hypothetical protein